MPDDVLRVVVARRGRVKPAEFRLRAGEVGLSLFRRTDPPGTDAILTAATVIAESFREGIPVIINLSQMSEPEARRLVDFASGLSQGLYGKIERVTSKVFLLSPSHVEIIGEEPPPAAEPARPGFFNQS